MDETIDVAPSEDTQPESTPSEPTKTEAPAAPVEPETTSEPKEPELYELPDGRKVDAQTLTKEWKENFLPDYTRKSQELAKAKTETLPEPSTSKYADPQYVPQTYEEILQEAEQRALRAVEAKEQARIEQQRALEDAVANQLAEVKKIDPSFNETALFLHANKYGFRDLKLAHQNMKDMNEAMKKVQTTTAQNIAKRSDPVSFSPGATGSRPDPSNFGSAVEYMRSLK